MPQSTQGTLTIKVPGFPEPLAFGDWVHDALFGPCEIGTADSTPLRALQNTVSEPISGGTRALTERDTNLPGPGNSGLPSGWAALIYSIQCVIAPGENISIADFRQLHLRCLLRFKISTKTYSEGPLYRFPAAGGIEGFTTTNDTQWLNNSGSTPGSRRGFVIPHYMKPSVSFAAEIHFGAAVSMTSTHDLEIHLEGLIKRPVL